MVAKKLSRRDFLQLAAVATTGAVLAACAPGTPEVEEEVGQPGEPEPEVADAGGETTTVSIQTAWFAQEEPGRDYWQRVIAAFEEKPENADLEIELINVGTSPEDMLTSIAGGTAPDIYHTYGGTTGTFDVEDLAPRGVAVPLDGLIETARYFQKDDYYPEQWEPKTWDGKVWGLPVTEGGPGGYAMTWHKRYFEEAGYDPDVGPETWDDVVDRALELSTYEESGAVDVVGFDPWDACGTGWGNWSMWYRSPGISEDKRTILFDQGNWPMVLEMFKEIYQGIGVETMEAHKDAWDYWTGHQGGFPNGKRAMLLNGYWQPGEMVSVLADQSWEIGYDWPPCIELGKKVMTFGGTHTLWMTKACDQPEQAFRFMDFVMSPEANIINYELRGGFVLSKPLLEQLDTSRYDGIEFFMGMVDEADEIITPARNSSPIGAEMNNLWNRARDEVIYDQKTPEVALLDITAELQASLDAAWQDREG